MQSADYVPGVSGWKIHDHVRLVLNEGNRRIHAEVKMITTAGPGQTNDQAAQELSDSLKSYTPAEATADTALTSRITGEASARADADMALAQRIDSVQYGLAATVDAPHSGDDAPDVYVKPEKDVEPLRMGRILFEGEPPRKIRAAQELLRKAGMGQLEVVQRANELKSPFVVIDGQVYIDEASITPAGFHVKVAVDEGGRHHLAGFGIDGTRLHGRLQLWPDLEEDARRLLQQELRPGGMLHR